MSHIPVTILTGFLGAGKTTHLINALKQEAHPRVAIIVNEFGDVGIDGSLLKGVAENVVELPGGALCCAALGDTQQALTRLLDVPRDFDRVIIETTGLADPIPLMHAFFLRPMLEKHFVLDAVVTFVDATNGLLRSTYPEWQSQVRVANLLVVTKTDLTNGAVPNELQALLSSLNPRAEITTHVDLFRFSAETDVKRTVEETPSSHAHQSGITSVYLKSSRPLSLERVTRFIGETLVLNGDRLLRYKGIFCIDGRPERFVFQGVGYTFTNLPDRPWGDGEPKESALILIGENIQKEEFEAAFRACEV